MEKKNVWNMESLQRVQSLENERRACWPRFKDKLFNSRFCLVPAFSAHQLSFNHIHTFTHQYFFWDNCHCFLLAQILNTMPTFPNCFFCLFVFPPVFLLLFCPSLNASSVCDFSNKLGSTLFKKFSVFRLCLNLSCSLSFSEYFLTNY